MSQGDALGYYVARRWRAPRFWLSKRGPNGHTGGVFAILNNLTLTARMAGHTLAYLFRGRWRQTSPVPRKACQIPADFLALCVANAPENASDDYVIARLNELGIRHTRLDFTYGDREAFTERFLDRLLTDRFRVCLHLVQPREEARAMLRQPEAAERWRAFVGDMLDRYGRRVELIEIGATCNRRKWAGYSPAAFFTAWQIAWEEARGRNLTIAGPNVTDFEPGYNTGWLGEFRRTGLLPSVHTDNLFVERATEPEAFDHKVAGQHLAGLFRFNLVRKAQLLQDIGAWAGVPTLMCAHVTWSLRRIARFLEDVEEKQADYLARYACLAAASGALARVYWGPLIGQREGLIDDGTTEYPEIPHVTYYEQARGEIKNYRLRPAFRTFQTVNRLLAGATFQRRLATGTGLEILEFVLNAECQAPPERYAQASRMQNVEERSQKSGVRGQAEEVGDQKEKQPPNPSIDGPNAQCRITAGSNPQSEIRNQKSEILLHAVWTTDGNGASADVCYPPELLAQAEIYARDGQRLERAPRMFSESPVFLVWAEDRHRMPDAGHQTSETERQKSENVRQTIDNGQRMAEGGGQRTDVRCPIPGFRFARQPGWDFDIVRAPRHYATASGAAWGTHAPGMTGVYLAEDGGKRVDIQALLELVNHGKAGDGEEKQTPNAESITKNEELRTKKTSTTHILRDARNTVWSVRAPWDIERTIVIKAFKPRSVLRRLLDCGKPNKAVRSWNGAQELLRRGLGTPTPIACLLPGNSTACATSYYICEVFAPAWSARDAFNAFSAGANEFQGYSSSDWYEAVAVFLQKLHTRGVYFRDLSAGNLLVRSVPVPHPPAAGGTSPSSAFPRIPMGELEFALIDTARARFYPHSLGLRLRLCDLMRICHPLFWPGRRIFVEKYLAHNGRRFSWWMKIPFWYYDGKHRLKNALKKIRL